LELDRSTWGLTDIDHYDITELALQDVMVSGEGDKEAFGASTFSLRLRVCNTSEEGFKLGHWPVVSADCMVLECVVHGDREEKHEEFVVSGCFDSLTKAYPASCIW
jgi:E3 ubiquitin-protein ligase SHPRH